MVRISDKQIKEQAEALHQQVTLWLLTVLANCILYVILYNALNRW